MSAHQEIISDAFRDQSRQKSCSNCGLSFGCGPSAGQARNQFTAHTGGRRRLLLRRSGDRFHRQLPSASRLLLRERMSPLSVR